MEASPSPSPSSSIRFGAPVVLNLLVTLSAGGDFKSGNVLRHAQRAVFVCKSSYRRDCHDHRIDGYVGMVQNVNLF